jgi:ankyrin repeat protein
LQKQWTPLHWAAEAGQFEVVEYLLQKGANINAKGATHTAMDWALDKNNIAMVEYLLKRGADINACLV